MAPPQIVNLVPHTHWDREWYLPFQSFRLKLVRLIDKVLELMEADERFVFTLDGQLQTVDDYLEIRPENEQRLRALVEEGRLAIGPWQVLMDEFLVSGETIWRNLEQGLARAREFGGEMRVGYLPDMFGHIAQMPQILRAHGLDNAVVWRGVPAVVDRHRFDWTGIDGSSVEAEYLPAGYGNAAYLLMAPDKLGDAVEALIESMRPFFGDDPVLAMYGTDHQAPFLQLVDVVERANAENDSVRIELATLGRALVPGTGARPQWTGEMRSGARANVLMNVTSARIDIKAAAARAERWLERYAEPLSALHGDGWPAEFLGLAWRRVIENSAHDSICGCSADEVSAQVLVRFAEAEALGRDLAAEALEPARAATPRGAAVIANPSPYVRDDVVVLELPVPTDWDDVSLETADGSRFAAQELSRSVAQLHRVELLGRDIPELVKRRLHGRELFGQWLNGFVVEPGPRLVFELDTVQDPPSIDLVELRTAVLVAAKAKEDERWEIVFRTRPRRRLASRVSAPALGWTGVRAVEGGTPGDAVALDGGVLENGLLRVEVGNDGTLRIGDLDGVGRIVRGFDVGDSYNYAPPADDVLVDRPDSVRVEWLKRGPVRASLVVRRMYAWPPDHVVDIQTHVELRAGEPFVRIRVAFDNPADDQRVRVHVPLRQHASHSYAEGQYAVVERGLVAEGGHGEMPLPTFPASSFVSAGGVALLLEHVSEYEVLEGRELALTVLRSTGWISRNTNPYREEPAGPELAIPDAQMRGRHSFSFAVYPHDGVTPGPDVLEQAERYRLPFLTAEGAGDAGELEQAEGLTLEGEGVVLTALRPHEVRVANETPEPRAALLGGETVELGPWEIRSTAR
ncbi:MAG: glycoside hydrolase family 38 C-terminal domain-containing protein [Actinomycetota bacterium]